MKSILSIVIIFVTCASFGQVPNRFDYPDTLWIYGQSTDTTYGLTPQSPIKVGGGILPKHIYRYLNNLVDHAGENVPYTRIGSCCGDLIDRKKPLTKFQLNSAGKEIEIYFDQYEWEAPQLIGGFEWKERRMGYCGEMKSDTIFHGYGLYFFKDGGYYKGLWEEGTMHGKGEMYIPDQEKYVGEFNKGDYHGMGILHFPDGGKYEGLWSAGKKEGNGKIHYPPNSPIDYIEGTFKDNEPTGRFVIYNKDKTQETQEF